ncbi:MAG: AAA family ATPase [Alphaproteobacteria bacterium]|nr:AAA family ATPase [Alphaproteobacteria bacterium]
MVDDRRSFIDETRFEVLDELGRGGMGVVWRVHDRRLGRQVALKTVLAPAADFLVPLKQEFRSRRDLSHPNLVQFYDLHADGQRGWFTMELVDGPSFFGWLGVAPTRRAPEASTMDLDLGADLTSAELLSLPAGSAPPAVAARQVLRPLGEDDLERAVQGFRDLFRGLRALHGSGQVHRDVKPANVRVDQAGRVVLLDFGLSADLLLSGAEVRGLAGTPRYMAPEQAAGEPIGPPADLYAVGVMLFEALTGTLFDDGPVGDVLLRRPTLAPRDPREIVPGLPAPLADLCVALLATDPASRPTADQAITRLGLHEDREPVLVKVATRRELTVGRDAEIEALTALVRQAGVRARPALGIVRGPSGIGKSHVVRCVLADLAGEDPLVLRARCHPQEVVPYKAVDAVVDMVRAALRELDRGERVALLPAGFASLAALFPVLTSFVPDAPEEVVAADAAEVRKRGAGAFAQLVLRLARGRAAVVWLDDVQWADRDSLVFVEALLRAEGPVVVLLSHRDAPQEGPFLADLAARHRAQVVLELDPLGALEARSLAQHFAADGAQLEAVVAQAAGNPFFLQSLARLGGQQGEVDFSTLLARQLAGLAADVKRLAHLACVAVRPSTPELLALALDRAGGSVQAELRTLEDATILRTVGTDADPRVAPYHDRICDEVVAGLDGARLLVLHRSLAQAIAATQPDDDEALLVHWRGAGEAERAGGHAVRAGDRALATLAFDQAAERYREALELVRDAELIAHAEEHLGRALAGAGRGAQAAEAFLRAAGHREGEDALAGLDLRRQAAEQYLKRGHYAAGWQVMSEVLRALEVPIPASPTGALAWSTARRFWRLGTGQLTRAASGTAPPLTRVERLRADTLRATALGFGSVDTTLSDPFHTRYAMAARAACDPSMQARALGQEAVMLAFLGGPVFGRTSDRVRALVHELAARTGDPYDQAWAATTEAIWHWPHGRFAEVVEHGERAMALWQSTCAGVHWEQANLRLYLFNALAQLGRLRLLRERVEEAHRDAVDRGDLMGQVVAAHGQPSLAWLAAGVDDMHHRVAADRPEAPPSDSWPETSFTTGHYIETTALVHGLLARGEALQAWEAVEAAWPVWKREFVLSLCMARLEVRHLRARAALACLEAERDAAPAACRAALAEDARLLARDPLPVGQAWASLVEAARRRLDGEAFDGLLEEARSRFDALDMQLYAQVAAWLAARLGGDAEGAAQAEEWFADEGVDSPRQLIRVVAPGFGVAAEAS